MVSKYAHPGTYSIDYLTATDAAGNEQQYTGSAGASYLWNDTRFSVDMLLGSGLREDLAAPQGIPLANGDTTFNIPNGGHLPYYRQVNTGVSHTFKGIGIGSAKNAPTVRLDIINPTGTSDPATRIYEIEVYSGSGEVLERTVSVPDAGRRSIIVGDRERPVVTRAGVSGNAWASIWLPSLLDGRPGDPVVARGDPDDEWRGDQR